MSGGHFEYREYSLKSIIEDLKDIIDKNKKEIPEKELLGGAELYEAYPDEKLYYNYNDKTIRYIKKTIKCLKKSYKMTRHIDYLICGDYSEDTFLEKITKTIKNNDKRTRENI